MFSEERSDDFVALDEALERLAEVDMRKSRVVELRFFGGLSLKETSQVLGVSAKTVQRTWMTARAWLRKEMGSQAEDDH